MNGWEFWVSWGLVVFVAYRLERWFESIYIVLSEIRDRLNLNDE